MKLQKNNRRFPRTTLDSPEVGLILYRLDQEYDEGLCEVFYADVINRNQGGAAIRAKREIKPSTILYMQIYDAQAKKWVSFQGEVKWTRQNSSKFGYFNVGVKFQKQQSDSEGLWKGILSSGRIPLPSDYEFFLRTRPVKYICSDAMCAVLNNIVCKYVKARERFITQGEKGDKSYLIQSGSCVIKVEKGEKTIPISRCSEGDIVGEMSLLTGEPRSAHVEAETDMKLWYLTKAKFEEIAEEFTEFRNFLTEIVAHRFSSCKETAERKIGKYLITDIIGHGGYSIVYKGMHSGLNMPVCVKMLKHDLAMEPYFQKNFRNEARTIAAFKHPNIVGIYDIEELYRTIFIIMEYLEGVSLKYLIKNSPGLPFKRVLNILTQVCAGLAYAHKRMIVHQDIKPANLFILPKDRVKILDFGLAASCGCELAGMEGTVYYMSPEQINCGVIDERTDIYALGITAYEMVAGRRPYSPEENLPALLKMHLEKEIPDPAEAVPNIPEELRTFIIRCCRRDPDERYRNVDQAMRELHPLAQRLGLDEKELFREEKKITTLHLIYSNSEQVALRQLVEDFSKNVKKLGVTLKASEFSDI
jgi:eukaryotic-like serine/threonine-protein kinase